MIQYKDGHFVRETMGLDELITALTSARKKLRKNQPVLVRFQDVSGWRLTSLDVLRKGDENDDEDGSLPSSCVLLHVDE